MNNIIDVPVLVLLLFFTLCYIKKFLQKPMFDGFYGKST